MEPQTITGVLSGHPEATGFLIFWLLSAAIQAMPIPTPTSSQGYHWLYAFAHALVGNVKHAGQQAQKK